MDWLYDPNFAYLLVVTSLLMAAITIIAPGTGIPEMLLLGMVAACWVVMQRVPPNGWALLLMVLSLGAFFLAVRQPRRKQLWLAGSTLLMIAGSVFLFTAPNGMPRVDLVLAAVTSLLYGSLVWVGVTRGIVAHRAHVMLDPDGPVGKEGEARTEIHGSGSVYVAGELWSARSDQLIPQGARVRVLRREGFVLTVLQAGDQEPA